MAQREAAALAEFPPPWADAWGDDAFGLWAEFAVGGVVQRLRWIQPGTFLMGSREDEPGRFEDEGPQHAVQISEGFWLADSACTQALWLAVMGGKSPAHFSDDPLCPVEQVSFEDVSAFLARVRESFPPGTEALLPTEAQWEYACRAGTDTPFSFGVQISTEQVNYDGNFPYAGGAKGAYRKRTVPVKSLPPNAWGLHEMHGNVWEWCADGTREYAEVARSQALADPQGPRDEGPVARRAVRGGSWLYDAGYCRSARRLAYARGYRYGDLGFRFALRSTSPGAPEGPVFAGAERAPSSGFGPGAGGPQTGRAGSPAARN